MTQEERDAKVREMQDWAKKREEEKDRKLGAIRTDSNEKEEG